MWLCFDVLWVRLPARDLSRQDSWTVAQPAMPHTAPSIIPYFGYQDAAAALDGLSAMRRANAEVGQAPKEDAMLLLSFRE